MRTDAGGYPNLRLEIVHFTNTLPGVIVFDLDSDRQTGASRRWTPGPCAARAPASRCETAVMVRRLWSSAVMTQGTPLAPSRSSKTSTGRPGLVQVDSFGNLQPAVFGHTATVVADKLVVYGGLTRFPT